MRSGHTRAETEDQTKRRGEARTHPIETSLWKEMQRGLREGSGAVNGKDGELVGEQE